MAFIWDHRNFKALSQQHSVQKNRLFTYRIQGQYTFLVLSAWESAELLSMKNICTTKVEVRVSLAPFNSVEKLLLYGGTRGGHPVPLLKLLLKRRHVNHWLAEADATCQGRSGQCSVSNRPFPSLMGPVCTAWFGASGLLNYVFSEATALCFMPSEPAQVSHIKLVADIYWVPVVVVGLDNVSGGHSC